MECRHLLSIADLTPDEVAGLVLSALKMKGEPPKPILQGKTVALLFEKPSLRTKVSFDVAISQLGGHCVYLGGEEVGLGKREPVKDVARVISRYVSALVVRTFDQSILETLARYASVPVINALSDQEHPCQALGDLLTIREKKGKLAGVSIAYVGDGNNVATSLALAAASVGADFIIASPRGHQVPEETWSEARRRANLKGARLRQSESPAEAVQGADVVYTDVWTSMGQEVEADRPRRDFAGYQVNPSLLELAKPDAIVMHDLPAHRGEEISDEALEGPQSVVFDQAENRLHAQKAILAELLSKGDM